MSDLQESQQLQINSVDSFNNPESLREDVAAMAMNVVMRGGIAQTRPGYDTVFNLPCGNLQGITRFKPNNSPETLVFCVEGVLYYSVYPFRVYQKIKGATFDKRAKSVAWANTVQSFDYDREGNLVTVRPKSILVMQDGLSRAIAWDGGEARYLDPTPSTIQDEAGNIVFQPDKNETPQGLWMVWAGNRLWVSRDKLLLASDYGNPLKFTEQLYIAEGRAFYMPEEVTGMIQPSFNSELIVFGQNTMTFVKANILERQEWLNTGDFIRTEDGIGCVSHRSIIKKNGLVWWYAPAGIINLNAALQFFNDSRLFYFDGPMIESKSRISQFRDRICAAEIEDYMLFSVPSGGSTNRHTWVADMIGGEMRWNGYWTGIKPVEWAKITQDGNQLLYCVSRDSDGVNRLWRAFSPNRSDNGEPITCYLRTRMHNFGTRLNKTYRYSEFYIQNMLGVVDAMVAVGGTHGGFSKVYTQRLIANGGPIEPSDTYGENQVFTDNVEQFRQAKTQQADWTAQSSCHTCSVESDLNLGTDRGFTHFIIWSGQMGIQGYKMYSQISHNLIRGECEQDESGSKSVNPAGCSSTSNFTVAQPFELYESTQTVTVNCNEGNGSATATAYSNSYISQKDADKKASGLATKAAEGLVRCGKINALTTEGGFGITTENGELLIDE